MIYKIEGFSLVNETEVDIFLEFLGFLYDPANVNNLISGSSAYSKGSLDVWQFLVHIILKPIMEDIEHILTNMYLLV